MKKLDSKVKKIIASVLIIAVILPTLAVSARNYISNKQKNEVIANNDENKTAEEISNMTGVPVEEILKYKKEGKNWNEILEILKNEKKINTDESSERRGLLTEANLGEDYVEKLKKEGFIEDEILEAKSLVERTVFQLQEITTESNNTVKMPEIDIGIEKEKEVEDFTAYSELMGKIDQQTAVYLLLKLKAEYGSIEAVMDEYLYSIQINVDLMLAIADKKAYEEEKNEKGSIADVSKIITLGKIEEQLLKKLQSANSVKTDELEVDSKTNMLTPGLNSEDIKPPLPDIGVEDIKPKDPLEDIMSEINEIKDRSFNIGNSFEGSDIR